MLLLVLMVSSPGLHAGLAEDYGYIFLGTCTSDGRDENGDYRYLYEGWESLDDGSFITPELDLSACTNPYLVWDDGYSEKWVSSDGVNFTLLNKEPAQRISLPKDTRYVKIKKGSGRDFIDNVVVIADVAYGPELNDVVDFEVLLGSYDADNQSFTLSDLDYTYEGRIRFNVPDWSTSNVVRTLQVRKGNYHYGVKIDTIKVRCKSGKESTLKRYSIEDNYTYLLPRDAETVEVSFTSDDDVFWKFEVRLKGITTDLKNKASDPATDLEQYYDIDGDGLLENINENILRPVQIYDGSWQFIRFSNQQYDRMKSFVGLNSNGSIYGVYNYRNFSNIDDIYNPSILYTAGDEQHIQKVTPIDYNLDGHTDYYINTTSSSEHPLLTLMPDGTAVESELLTMTPEEYAGVRSELQLSTGGDGVPGMGDMFGRDGVAATFNPSETVDINSDGLPDFLDAESGTYLLNIGDGRFVKSSFGNRVVLRDFDGDGVNDILIWEYKDGNVKLYNGADTSKDPLMLFTNLRIEYLYCRDVDRDGDVDVVALIDCGYYSEEESYVLISENQGGNKFRRREHYIEGKIRWTKNSLLDLDADGKYELLGSARGSYPYQPYMVKILSPSEVKVEQIKNIETSPQPSPTKASSDGGWMIFVDDTKATKTYAPGTRPTKPGTPMLHYDAATRRLKVSWAPGSDAETSTADLTYELRIGTAPGLGDIAAAQSLPDGKRRCLRNGANGYSTFAVYNVDSWPEGKVYISCQTIDADFAGSEFSEPAVFEKTSPACDFVFTTGNDFATWIAADVELAFTPVQGVTYEWNFADAEVLSLDPATMKASIRFSTPGDKVITLTSRSASGVETVVTKKINVAPVHYHRTSDCSPSGAIDIDGDGFAEFFSHDKFYKENADGEFETVKKSFNTTTGISTFHVADVDGDGLADVFDRNNLLINYGDGDMEKIARGAQDKYPEWTIYDFNNDGKIDAWQALNQGDYLTAVDPDWGVWPYSVYDFNGDGLVDIANIVSEPDPDNPFKSKRYPMHIFENIDGYSFKPGKMIEMLADRTTQATLIDDLDGDGLADYILNDAASGFGVTSYVEFITIRWGSGVETKIQCPDGNPFGPGIEGVFDFNNDGMKDLSVTLQNYSGIVTIDPETRVGTTTEITGTYYPGVPYARLRNGDLKMSSGVVTAAPNERPLPPTALRSSQDERGVVIEWNPGSDKETPVKGLRYNVAVKHKGKTGEGAYLISPLNGGDASVPLPMPIYLPTAPKFTIPTASIPAGEYEVTVQTIDGQNDGSEFSEVYNLTVRPQALAKLPTSGMVGEPVLLVVLSNTANVEIDFGSDAQVRSMDATRYSITWSTEGLKQIKFNGEKAAEIYINPAIDASFTIDPGLLSGASVNIENVRADGGKWEYSLNGGKFRHMLDNDEAVVESRDKGVVCVRFLKAGEYVVRHTVNESYGNAYYEQNTSVESLPAEIGRVTAEGSHFKVEWNPASAPYRASAARIYKETAVYNMYELIGETPVDAGEFVDLASNSAVKTARYKLSYVMPYGETAPSVPHQPMHVQVNQGIGSAINLVWSRYEGLEVESYRVLKGTSPEDMSVYDTLSGNLTSFTDAAGDAADHCYSIEMVAPSAPAARSRAQVTSPRSNVVWGGDAAPAVLATSVAVSPVSGGAKFNGRRAVSLQARVLPTNATISKVNWEVVSGADYMDVDIYGNVTAKDYGKAVIRATAMDGSGTYGEIELENNEILLTWLEFTAWPQWHELCKGESFQYKIKTEPADATEKPVWESSDTSVATVTQDGLVEAVGIGNTTISVHGKGEGMYIDLSLKVTYPNGYVFVEGINITPAQYSGAVGDEVQFTATVVPANATEPGVIWSILPGGEDVAEVDQTGKVRILAEGEARVKATSESDPYWSAVAFITGMSGIDSVLADSDGPWAVYTIGGTLLMKEATKDDISKLRPGFYIIGCHTVFLTGK